MQVKPRFKSYSILEKYPLFKDDTGNEFCLTLFSVTEEDDEDELIEDGYKFWTIVGKELKQHNNKALSFESIAYWKGEDKEMLSFVVNGFKVQEQRAGVHRLFDNDGLRTRFVITRNK